MVCLLFVRRLLNLTKTNRCDIWVPFNHVTSLHDDEPPYSVSHFQWSNLKELRSTWSYLHLSLHLSTSNQTCMIVNHTAGSVVTMGEHSYLAT